MSYRTIISVVNGQTASAVTTRYAMAMAAACGSELVLYAADDTDTDEHTLRPTKRHLEHLFAMRAVLRPDQAAKFDRSVTRALTPEVR